VSSVELFSKGGPVMYLLLACSLSAMAIAIDRLCFYRKAEKNAAELLAGLYKRLRGQAPQSALQELEQESSAVAFLVKAGLRAAAEEADVAMAVDNAYSEAALQLRSRMSYLSTIVTLSPLLGLLGTIFGMISSFNIFNLQAGQPLAITGGIGEALIATACGLFVAIFALVIHAYFAQRMDRVLTELDKTKATVVAALG